MAFPDLGLSFDFDLEETLKTDATPAETAALEGEPLTAWVDEETLAPLAHPAEPPAVEAPAPEASAPALREWHHIVYREAPRPGDASPPPMAPPAVPQWQRRATADAVLLFRYSALTFNGHRIHYDRAFATGVEGYPGLVVHGPLLATLLLDLLREHRRDAVLDAFEFRALRPLFDGAAFTLCGAAAGDARVRLWVLACDGAVAVDATATLRRGAHG